jgi:hypothetical protein
MIRTRRLAALGASVLAAAVSLTLLHAATWVPVDAPPVASPEPPPEPRRAARPGVLSKREVPLVRLSRVHVAARMNGFLRSSGAGPGERAAVLTVLLDTGSSMPLATVDGQEALGLEVGMDPPLVSRGFSGEASPLFVLSRSQELVLSFEARGAPDAVTLPVAHLSPNRLYGAHVIAPLHLLAPRGGAVGIDFGADRLSVCESAEACLAGGGPWTPLSTSPCVDRPELAVVEARLGGRAETLLLDTGAATLLFEEAYRGTELAGQVTASATGSLFGAGSAEVRAARISGAFAMFLGAGGAIRRAFSSAWVVPVAPEQRPARCATAGSIGADLLEGCRVVLVDGPPLGGFLSCAGPGPP